MPSYQTCKGCQKLIDLHPAPRRDNMQMWPSPMVIDTTVTINGKRFCENCGKNKLAEKHVVIVKGYRIDDGSVLSGRLIGGSTYAQAASDRLENEANGHAGAGGFGGLGVDVAEFSQAVKDYRETQGPSTLTYTGPVPEGLPETDATASRSSEQPELKFPELKFEEEK
jgi:hypothetical protein